MMMIDTVDSWKPDPRPEMDFGQPYPLGMQVACTAPDCGHPAVYVTKTRWHNQPLGHLYSRCEYHQSLHFDRSM